MNDFMGRIREFEFLLQKWKHSSFPGYSVCDQFTEEEMGRILELLDGVIKIYRDSTARKWTSLSNDCKILADGLVLDDARYNHLVALAQQNNTD